jgi:hypothetical protein
MFKTALSHESGDPWVPFSEKKTEGRTSRETVPLRAATNSCICCVSLQELCKFSLLHLDMFAYHWGDKKGASRYAHKWLLLPFFYMSRTWWLDHSALFIPPPIPNLEHWKSSMPRLIISVPICGTRSQKLRLPSRIRSLSVKLKLGLVFIWCKIYFLMPLNKKSNIFETISLIFLTIV